MVLQVALHSLGSSRFSVRTHLELLSALGELIFYLHGVSLCLPRMILDSDIYFVITLAFFKLLFAPNISFCFTFNLLTGLGFW